MLPLCRLGRGSRPEEQVAGDHLGGLSGMQASAAPERDVGSRGRQRIIYLEARL